MVIINAYAMNNTTTMELIKCVLSVIILVKHAAVLAQLNVLPATQHKIEILTMGHVCATVDTLMIIARMKPVMNATILAMNVLVSPALIVHHVVHLITEL